MITKFKQIIIVLTSVLLASSVDPNPFPNDLSVENLKGPVKQIETRKYVAWEKDGKIIKGKPVDDTSISIYDQKGNLMEIIIPPNYREVYTYSERGLKAEKKVYRKGNQTHKSNFLYIFDDQEITEFEFELGGTATQIVTKFHPNKKIESIKRYAYPSFVIEYEEIFDYQNNGCLLAKYTSNYHKGKRVPMFNSYHQCDSFGNDTKIESRDLLSVNDELLIQQELRYKYDDKKNWISCTVINLVGNKEIFIIERTIIYY